MKCEKVEDIIAEWKCVLSIFQNLIFCCSFRMASFIFFISTRQLFCILIIEEYVYLHVAYWELIAERRKCEYNYIFTLDRILS